MSRNFAYENLVALANPRTMENQIQKLRKHQNSYVPINFVDVPSVLQVTLGPSILIRRNSGALDTTVCKIF